MRTKFGVILATVALASCASAQDLSYSSLFPHEPDRSAEDIMKAAHEAAGGDAWVRPKTLSMDGYGVFYRDGQATRHERHTMYRAYDAGKADAHRADGKVRITSLRDGIPIIDVAFDGAVTSTANGPQPQSEADQRWASNFGFGVIRHALDEGYSLSRLPDDLVDGKAAYWIKVIDPVGGETQFAIAHDDHAILSVAFDTERGWHQRIYSDFYSKPGVSWVQPRRVRLFYNGVKANEVIWTRHVIDAELPDCLFTLPERDECTGPFDTVDSTP
ncbi:MAG: hypothetical protein AAFP97_03465 [Pseudomonadota bacterium]